MPTPFVNRPFVFKNPDGTTIHVLGWGDEHHAVFETVDGFTVINDPKTGFWRYAQLSDDRQQLVPTEMGAEDTNTRRPAVPPHLRQHPAVTRAQALQSREVKAGQRRWEIRRAQRRAELDRRLLAGPGTAPPAQTRTGNYVGLCLLIQFPDVSGTINRQEVTDFCNKQGYTGYNNNGSVYDYYLDNSAGKLHYTNLVTAYYTAKQKRSYYTDPKIAYGTRAQELIKEALDSLKSQNFNFGQLSTDSGGYVYALNAFYAGGTVNNWAQGLWPHSSGLATPYDAGGGRKLCDYQITDIGSGLTLRTFCHENGHMLCDFPDLYDYGYQSEGDGNYCLMAYGGSDTNPVEICSYLKYKVGWATKVTQLMPGDEAKAPAGQNQFFLYMNPKKKTEYFLIENREQQGRDAALPASGLAIWHIDELGSNDNEQGTAAQHYECALEQADGRYDLEHGANYGDNADLFASPRSTQFSDKTSPGAKWWDGTASGLDIAQISPAGNVITFIHSGFITWPNSRAINNFDSTPEPLSACVFNGVLSLFWKANDPSNRLWTSASADGLTWPFGHTINTFDSTPKALSACVFNGYLHVFWKANDPSNRIWVSASSNGLTWPDGHTINTFDSTPEALSACVFNGRLYAFWKANDASNRIWVSASSNGVTWPNGHMINNADSTPKAVTSCVFNGKLYVFWKSNDSGNHIYYSASADGLSWPNGRMINGFDSTPEPPAACVYDNKLFLFWKANDTSNTIYCSGSTDGLTWPNAHRINQFDSTPAALTACVFNDQIYAFWKANDPSNRIFYSTNATAFPVAEEEEKAAVQVFATTTA